MHPLPPLSLYIHFPWCVQKCPYCDFNSHTLRGTIDEVAYVDALLADLEQDLPLSGGRELGSIFMGGGTPSLFSPVQIGRLLDGINRLLPLAADAEFTLEANPGTVELARFAGYRQAGINRLSIGIQSLEAEKLQALGRIHGPAEARRAAQAAQQAGFDNFNLDLMFGLPGQTLEQAMADLQGVIDLAAPHLSWYQLTLEPNTAFHHAPPVLPDNDALWDIQEAGQALLASAGYGQYEISAYARPGHRCRHNLNYWQFGDYLGVGAGAHGKLSLADGRILRRWKPRHPAAYQADAGSPAGIAGEQALDADDRVIEFMMNALRLNDGVPEGLFCDRTGLSPVVLMPGMNRARQLGLLADAPGRLQPSEHGRRFLNDLLAIFGDNDDG